VLAGDEHGRRALVAGEHSRVWDVDGDREALALGGSSDNGSLSPAGDVVLTWHDPRHVELWDIDAHRVRARITLDYDLLGCIGYAADGKHVLLGIKDSATLLMPIPFAGHVNGYDLATGARTFQLPQALLSFLSPDRRTVVASGVSRDITLHDVVDGHLVSRMVFGTEMLLFGTLVQDGTLLFAGATRALEVRSLVDGRVLSSVFGEPQMAFTQDSVNEGVNFNFADGGHTVVTLGSHPLIWRLPLERRSPQEIDNIVRDRVRWRVVDGRLVPVEATLHGRVTRHGAPVAGADVRLEHIGLTSWPKVTTDADGRYAFEHLPYQNCDVNAATADHTAHGMVKVAIDHADVAANIDLDEEASISGTVVDEHDNPVAGVRVNAIGMFVGDTSAADGRFTIGALRGGRFHVGAAEAPGLQVAPPIDVELRSKQDSVTGVKIVVKRVAP
jgi:hypothetical protein